MSYFADDLISNISALRPLLDSLLNLPGISTEVRKNIIASSGESYTLLTRLGLNGIGGLTELLNLVFYFLIGLSNAIPSLLGGVPLGIFFYFYAINVYQLNIYFRQAFN